MTLNDNKKKGWIHLRKEASARQVIVWPEPVHLMGTKSGQTEGRLKAA
jgi:hypothetical protein